MKNRGQAMDINEMDSLTIMQRLRGGHYEEVIIFLIDELMRQNKRISELEKALEREKSDMR